MKTPIHEVLRRIRPLPPIHKADHLRSLIENEPKRSIRRKELQYALRDVITKQLRKEGQHERRDRRQRQTAA